jgi:hypothetical protein
MTSSRFRTLLVLCLLSVVAAFIFEWAFQAHVPAELNEEIWNLRGQPSDSRLLLGLGIGLIGFVLSIISTFGLFTFKSWAPKLAVTSTCMGAFSLTLMGAALASGGGASLGYVSSVLWGCVLAIAHTPIYVGYRQAVAHNGPISA